MTEAVEEALTLKADEQALRAELARLDRSSAAARELLRQLLEADHSPLLTEEMVARVNGMLRHIARQLLEAQVPANEMASLEASRLGRLASALRDEPQLLAHCLTEAAEGQALERLRIDGGVDPVLPPLVQELAAKGPRVAALAMKVLAAQARFLQHYRRFELPLRDLPAELFHLVLGRLGDLDGGDPEPVAIASLRGSYDESAGRLSLLSQLIAATRDTSSALNLHHAGLSIFTTALAAGSGQPRAAIITAVACGQSTRLALALRAAGLPGPVVSAQLAALGSAPLGYGDLEQFTPRESSKLLRTAAEQAAN